MPRLMTFTALMTAAAFSSPAAAVDLYVDNLQGSNSFDGRAQLPLNRASGPVLTIRRALELAETGDTIHITNNGQPYFESLQLAGGRLSGYGAAPLTLEGNGAVISGLRTLPPESWKSAAENVWTFTPWRKAYYQLLLDGRPIPRFVPDGSLRDLTQIPEGHFYAHRGTIYYKSPPLVDPRQQPFQFAYEDVGITLYQVRHVVIRNLTVRHFRLDGINAHDLCFDVVLENVTAIENGRAGVAAGGTAEVRFAGGRVADNRIDQIRISEQAVVGADDELELSAPPTLVE